MATKSRAEMMDLLLEHIGVKAAGVTADTTDTTLAGIIVDSVYTRLRAHPAGNLAPYATSAFPEWAQLPFLQIAAADCVQPFQLGQGAKAQIEHDYQRGMRETCAQMQLSDVAIPVTFRDY